MDEKQLKTLRKNINNRMWRLSNLYYIINKSAKKVLFKPNEAQMTLLKNMHTFNLILKARQRGFTTLIQLLMLDAALFTDNLTCGVIAHNKDDAEKFFHKKIKFAYKNLPDLIKRDRDIVRETSNQLEFSNGSSIQVATSFRSGTSQFLHVSEHGKLCAKYPDKAKEVKTGAFNAVEAGQLIFVESTAEGNSGDFYDMCMAAQRKEAAGIKLSGLDFKFHFFPWWEAKEYASGIDVPINEKMGKYFKDVERRCRITLSREQKNWYIQKEELMTDAMKQEFPSYAEEAFEASVEGAYFHRQMASLRKNGRITKVPHDPRLPVFTFWDLGRDTTPIWFFQYNMRQYHFIDYFENSNEDLAYYAHILRGRGLEKNGIAYNYGTVYLPHDGKKSSVMVKDQTPETVLRTLGFNDIRIVPRTSDKTNAIQGARQVLPLCYFDSENCAEGIVHLDNYRKEWDEKHETWKPTPRHDKHSHGADGFMVFSDGFHVEHQQAQLKEDYQRTRVSVPNGGY